MFIIVAFEALYLLLMSTVNATKNDWTDRQFSVSRPRLLVPSHIMSNKKVKAEFTGH